MKKKTKMDSIPRSILAIYNYGILQYASKYNHRKKNNELNENEFY